MKQLLEYHLAVKIVKECEQQRTAGGNLEQEEQQSHPSSSSECDGWWTSSWVGQIVAMERRNPRLLQAELECL